MSQGEKELRSANNCVKKNPNIVASAKRTMATTSHISFGTSSEDIRLSNLYSLIARTQGKIPSKVRKMDTIEFEADTTRDAR